MTPVDGATAEKLVRFLGLADVVDPRTSWPLHFPLGVLYPYSAGLRRVYERYVGVAQPFPEAVPLLVGELPEEPFELPGDGPMVAALDRYLVAIEALYGATAFAPGSTGAGLARAHRAVADAIASTQRRTPAGAGR